MLIKKMLFAYYDTQCLYTITKLKIADYLQHTPKTIQELAKSVQTDENKLYRIMRFLAAKGLFTELPNKTFQINDESKYLISTASNNINHFIDLHAEYFYCSAGKLASSLKNSTTPFELTFGELATDYFKHDHTAGEIYNQAMKENSILAAQLITKAYDFSPYKLIVDIGSGIGSLLVNILLVNKSAHGINFDLPQLHTAATKYLQNQQITDRCCYIGGDFFKEIPQHGDIYIMKAILHGKNDQDAIQILNQVKKVLTTTTPLLLIERIIPDSVDLNYVDSCVNDINMLNVTQGQVRTLPEYEAIFQESGYKINKIYSLANDLSIIEIKILAKLS